MASRYRNRQIVRNDNELYESFLEDRGLNIIRHYRTPTIKHPTGRQRRQLRHSQTLW